MSTETNLTETPSSPGETPVVASVSPVAPIPPIGGEATPAAATPLPSDTGKPEASPKEVKAPAKPGNRAPEKPHRKWNPPKPASSKRMYWHIFVVSTAFVILLFTVVARVVLPNMDASSNKLGDEFTNKKDNYAIKPPLHWNIQDRVPETSLVMLPRSGKYTYPPLIMIVRDNNAMRFASYLQEHKSRIAFKDKSVKWLGEGEDFIDGCRTARLEYEWDGLTSDDKPVKVRTIQYVLEDRLRYYWITCSAAADDFPAWLSKFEASARSFNRTAILPQQPQMLPTLAPQ